MDRASVEISLSSVQKALRSLERDGLVAARNAGRTGYMMSTSSCLVVLNEAA